MADALTLLGRGNSVMQRIRKAVGQRAEAVLGQLHQEAGEGSRVATAESIHGK